MAKHLKKYLVFPTLILLGFWGIAVVPGLLTEPQGLWEIRKTLIILSGILALTWMTSIMIMALRPRWLEQRLGGLDKLYRLHKWYGIGAGVIVLTHWLLEIIPKNMVGWGMLEKPQRHGPKIPDAWVDLAKVLGEWGGYILMALVVIALIKRIPYNWFRAIHKYFGIIFLMGAYHGVMLLPKEMLTQPIGWITIACAVMGSIAALISLFGAIGRKQRYPARLVSSQSHSNGIVEVCCQADENWPGHRPGQFILITFDKAEGSHPFTIASAWNPESRLLTLAIKALGDYTSKLSETLTTGQSVSLEGPYGDFTFSGTGEQVWVAGGCGITPFLARMEELAKNGGTTEKIDFFYSVKNEAELAYPDRLEERCQQAGVQLHCRYTDHEGPQPATEITQQLKPNTSVWFCGPGAWGKALEQTLQQSGLAAGRFHREFFEFR